VETHLINTDAIVAAAGSVAAITWTISKILRVLHFRKAERIQSVLDILETAALEIYHSQIRPRKLAAPDLKLSDADVDHYARSALQTARSRALAHGLDLDATIPPHKQRLALERAVQSLKNLSDGRRVKPPTRVR
jgi:hypothetical protein